MAATYKLCERCAALGLSVEKFRTENNNSIEAKLPTLSLQFLNERLAVGTVGQLRDGDEGCEMCSLIFRTVRDVPDIDDDITYHLLWEIDGRIKGTLGSDKGGKRTRRLRICWNDAKLKQCEWYLVLAAPARYNDSNLDYPKLLNNETEFLGRRIGAMASRKNLIREFLRLCEKNHGERCTQKLGIERSFRETLMEPYFGVIDIENETLVPLPFKHNDRDQITFEPYATMSYVWGASGDRKHRTKIGNIQNRRKSGGLASVIENLPKSLRQSILLVHSLGIKYIWIDALCIVQDSSHSWNLNARAMHLIYGNSTFTVCAADGSDAEKGLLSLENDPEQLIATYSENVHLILHQPPEISIEASEWNKRAWTFQERLLSKCCLIFTGGRVYFQCRSTGMSEDIFADGEGRGWSLDLVRSPLQMLSQLKQRSLWFYAQCVFLYTQRELYEAFDVLAAFSGICTLMEGTMKAPFAFGLPTSHFDFALLWEPIGKSSRLKEATVSSDQKYKDMKFPSWSWCGWKSGGIEYKQDMVKGCVADIRAWLTDHTWIDWRIREGHGTLRRVWDQYKEGAAEDESENDKWKGYKVVTAEIDERDTNTSTAETGTNTPTSYESEPQQRRARRSHHRDRSHHWDRSRHRDRSHHRSAADSTTGYDQSVTSQIRDHINRLDATTDHRGLYVNRDPEVPRVEGYDNYGRPHQSDAMVESLGKDRVNFTLTLPEDPYNVRTTEESENDGSSKGFPDQPFLQFFTWMASFYVVRALAPQHPEHGDDVGSELCRCHIADRRGDKCGSIIVDSEWLSGHESRGATEFKFIAISDAKSFTLKEFPDWTYYIPKERIESEWDLYFVLLIEYFPEEGIYRRFGLGKVFKAAFTRSDDEWKEVILG